MYLIVLNYVVCRKTSRTSYRNIRTRPPRCGALSALALRDVDIQTCIKQWKTQLIKQFDIETQESLQNIVEFAFNVEMHNQESLQHILNLDFQEIPRGHENSTP